MAVFQCTTKIVSGPRALEYLKTVKANSVLLVTDRYFSESGIAKAVAAGITGAAIHLFDRVAPDPPAELAAEGAVMCVTHRPDVLLALGGGSVIDCAKGILSAYGEKIPFIAIPTTSGSGSDVTSYAILTKDGVKHPLVDERLRPEVTILDESLLHGLPPSLIADTGMDLMAHCMEALVGTNRSTITDALAVSGIRTVLQFLVPSYRGDSAVRGPIHEAATMAGLAFDHAGLGLCHALAHSLGGLLHIPHGRLCAMLLPHVMEFNAGTSLTQYARLARLCGLSAVTEHLALKSLQSELRRLRRELNLPDNLAQAGITRERWERCRETAVRAALEDPCCQTNPNPVTRTGVENILKAVAP